MCKECIYNFFRAVVILDVKFRMYHYTCGNLTIHKEIDTFRGKFNDAVDAILEIYQQTNGVLDYKTLELPKTPFIKDRNDAIKSLNDFVTGVDNYKSHEAFAGCDELLTLVIELTTTVKRFSYLLQFFQ